MSFVNRSNTLNFFDKIKESDLPSLSLNKQISTRNINSTVIFENNIYNFKVIMVGDLAVGKTSLLNRFVKNEFKNSYISTIGVEYSAKNLIIDKINECRLKIWDTSGEERFRSITKQYFKDTQGAILIFDLTKKSTFDKLNVWLEDLNDNAPEDVSVILVGNKMDIKDRKIYLSDDAKKFALKNKMPYIEVSAKEGTNVVYLFETLCKKLVNKSNNRMSINLNSGKKEKKNKKESFNIEKNIEKKKSIELDKKIFEGRGKIENKKSKCC